MELGVFAKRNVNSKRGLFIACSTSLLRQKNSTLPYSNVIHIYCDQTDLFSKTGHIARRAESVTAS